MSVSNSGDPSPVATDGGAPRNQDARRRIDHSSERRLSNEGLGVVNGRMINSMNLGGGEFRHRRETMLRRLKYIVEMNKGVLASNAESSRRKKSKEETPRWKLALTILTKFCLLLVTILWLGQFIWNGRGIMEYSRNTSDTLFDTPENDARLSEVEITLKTTAKMLQVQLDVVNKKIGVGVLTAKILLNKQLEEKGMFVKKELKRLEGRTDAVVKSLSELKSMELLSKEEFRAFADEFKKSRDLDHREEGASLDDIGEFCRELVEKEIEKHVADGLGRIDYALASGGAKVIGHSEPYTSDKSNTWLTFVEVRGKVHSNAQKMLEPSFGEPGQCFALQGDSGFVIIKLRAAIIPQAFTIEHVSKNVAYDRSSAPKDGRVFAWFEGPGDDPSNSAEKMIPLAEFSYDIEKRNAQTFRVETADSKVINMVRLEFSSNHGSSKLTCLYRFRVHGHEPNLTATEMHQ